jgi:hypothetical protein
VEFVYSGAGFPGPYFLGDKDTFLFAATKLNASVAMHPRKAGFFLLDLESDTSYQPVWGHLQVSTVRVTRAAHILERCPSVNRVGSAAVRWTA